jgi:B9 domain-containing protein 2
MIVRVWRLDEVGRIDLISYGVCSMPTSAGYFKLQCPTWRPLGDWSSEAFSFFVGNPPRINVHDAITKGKRNLMKTVASGTVHFELEVLLRNFDSHSVSGQHAVVHEDIPY